MAALTLAEKQAMLSKPGFLDRMRFALEEKAHYWNNFPAVGSSSGLGDYNLRMQKRKVFSKNVLNGAIPDMNVYSHYFLFLYNTASPNLISGGVYDGQITDADLINGTYQDPTLDNFAGIQTGDDTESIDWSFN